MTPSEWIFFIIFTIAINVVMQVLAWKIGSYLVRRSARKEKKHDNTERLS